VRHKQYRRARGQHRQELFDRGLLRHPEINRSNNAMIVAILLLFIGLTAIIRVALSAGPL
jgi:hypothetical protein